MNEAMDDVPVQRLNSVLDVIGPMALAVSGGVDSMTLAHVAQTRLGGRITMYHALSPAVPAAATRRVREHAASGGWNLVVINAREMADPRYLENPVNRCFFCKTNLYARIAGLTAATIASGTNLDDLDDFRPGLDAAREQRVRHPYVESGIAKQDVRAIARMLRLDDLAELPAAPCLSSRIETGIRVTSERLALVEAVEDLLRSLLGEGTIRCRVRRSGIAVELEPTLLARIGDDERQRVAEIVATHGVGNEVSYLSYRRGSAFLTAPR